MKHQYSPGQFRPGKRGSRSLDHPVQVHLYACYDHASRPLFLPDLYGKAVCAPPEQDNPLDNCCGEHRADPLFAPQIAGLQ